MRPWLLLDALLEAHWHERPWEEELRARGLTAVGCVACCARVRFGSNQDCFPTSASYWINLFPPASVPDGFAFAETFQEAAAQRQLQQVPYARLEQAAIPADADLFILAHADARGLLDRHKNPLPEDWLLSKALPGRVRLLACNVDGAMYRLAEKLLAHGVRTVVCATGTLSAPAIALLVRQWTQARMFIPFERWLWQIAGEDTAEGGARRLTVFDEFTLDASPVSHWHEAVWDDSAYPNRANLERTLERDHDQFEKVCATVLQGSALWSMAYDYLFPRLLRVAENINHSAMRRLQNHAPERKTPDLRLALAESAYRLGHPPQVAAALVAALQSSTLSLLRRYKVRRCPPRCAPRRWVC